MQALGFAHEPVLGIINHEGRPVSLCRCPLYSKDMQEVLSFVESWIKTAGISPYRIDKKKGELKFVLLNKSEATQELMLRFVLKSDKAIAQIREYLPLIVEKFPLITVVSVNIQPVHMAIIEGAEEIFLTQKQQLKEYFNQVPLYIRPRTFFQTNPHVASQLYLQAKRWTKEVKADTLWDLFCGVGGFGLHCADTETALTGIEIAQEAIGCARASAEELGIKDIRFQALDSASFAQKGNHSPQLIIVNPPRRGLEESLCQTLQEIAPHYLLYSSCNAKTLAEDLQRIKGYRIQKVQLFDMFAHTAHYEVLVLLKRDD